MTPSVKVLVAIRLSVSRATKTSWIAAAHRIFLSSGTGRVRLAGLVACAGFSPVGCVCLGWAVWIGLESRRLSVGGPDLGMALALVSASVPE